MSGIKERNRKGDHVGVKVEFLTVVVDLRDFMTALRQLDVFCYD